MDNALKCRKCGECPQIRSYRDGIDGYIAVVSCRCDSVMGRGDIVRWAMNRAVEKWNEKNGGR